MMPADPGSRTVAVLCFALLMVMVGFATYGVVLPGVSRDLGLTEAQAGFAGGIFFLAYAVASPLCSALTDMFQPKRIYLAGCAAGLVGGLWFPLVSDSYAALLTSRALSGLGMAGAYLPGMTLLTGALPPERRARSASLYTAFLTLGTSLSFASAALLRTAGGWPAAFVGAAVACAVAAVLVAVMVGPRQGPNPGAAALMRNLKVVLKSPGARMWSIASWGNAWEGMSFRIWWIALLSWSAAQPGNEGFSGVDFALLSSVSGLMAMPLSAWVARKAESSGQRERVVAAAAMSSVVAGAILIVFMGQTLWLVFPLTLLYACAIFSDVASLPVAAMAQVPAEARGAVLAVQAFLTNAGSFVGAWVGGVVLSAAGGANSLSAWRWCVASMMAGSLFTALMVMGMDVRKRRAARAQH
jgi:MFS family permease